MNKHREDKLTLQLAEVKHQLHDFDKSEKTTLRLLLDNINVMVWYIKDGYTFGLVNQAFADFFGISKDKIESKPVNLVLNATETKRFTIENLKVLANRKAVKSAHWITNKDEELRLIAITRVPIINKDNVPYLVCTGEDITDLYLTQQELKRKALQYQAVVVDQTELICRFLPDTTLTFVNDAYCRYFGKTSSELLGKSFLDLVPLSEHTQIRKNLATLSISEPARTYEHKVIYKDGSIRWQQWTDKAIFNADKSIKEMQSVGRDITDRILMEQALQTAKEELEIKIRERTQQLNKLNTYLQHKMLESEKDKASLQQSEENFRILAETTPTMIIIFQNNLVQYVNNIAVKLTGYPKEELLNTDAKHIIHPDFYYFLTQIESPPIKNETPSSYEIKIITRNGAHVWLKVNKGFMTFNNKPAIIIAAYDITERKKMEEALSKSVTYYRTIFENGGNAAIIVDDHLSITAVNTQFQKMSGYSKKAIMGKKLYDFINRKYINKLGTIGRQNCEVVLTDRTNTAKHVLLNYANIPDTDQHIITFVDISELKITQKQLKLSLEKVHRLLSETVDALAAVLERKDPYTAGHHKTVT